MLDNISLVETTSTYSIRAAGAVLGESARVIELHEAGHDPVLYVPREDLAMAFFDKTDHTTHCPFKGDASYYTIQAKSGPITNAAWSYEVPNPGLERIQGYLAFYTDKVTLEAF